MKRLGFAICVLVLAAPVAQAQNVRVVAQDQKFGKGKITTIEKLPDLNPSQPLGGSKLQNDNGDDIKVEKVGDKVLDVRDMGPACVTLCASEWTCGRCFTDERNRRWCLTSGSPVVEKPALMKGWVMQGDSGTIFFLHESGAIYRRGGVVTPAAEKIFIVP
jgi:hypothetical protein